MSFDELTLADLAAPQKNAIVGGPFGSNLVSKDYVEAGVPVIRGTNMGEKWVGGEFVYVSNDKAIQLSQNIARPNDLVFTQRGTLGQVSIVPNHVYDRYVVSQSQMKITVDPRKANVNFLYYLFNSPDQLQYIRNSAIQTGVPHTNLGILKKTPIKIPPLEVQNQVASVLSALDDRITLLRETNVTLEAIAQALFKSWFVDFDPVRAKQQGRESEGMDSSTAALFPDNFEESELGMVPKGWQVASVGDVVEIVGGGTPNTKEAEYWEPAEFAWTTPKDLSNLQSPVLLKTERLLSAKGISKVSSGLLPMGTLLLSSRAPIGYLAIAQIPLAINQGYIAILPSSQLPPLYMYFWCKQNMDVIKSRANGSTFMEISKKAFRPIPVLVPPIDLLANFLDISNPIFARMAENEQQAQTLATLRDTLLPRLISGQLRLPEAEELFNKETTI